MASTTASGSKAGTHWDSSTVAVTFPPLEAKKSTRSISRPGKKEGGGERGEFAPFGGAGGGKGEGEGEGRETIPRGRGNTTGSTVERRVSVLADERCPRNDDAEEEEAEAGEEEDEEEGELSSRATSDASTEGGEGSGRAGLSPSAAQPPPASLRAHSRYSGVSETASRVRWTIAETLLLLVEVDGDVGDDCDCGAEDDSSHSLSGCRLALSNASSVAQSTTRSVAPARGMWTTRHQTEGDDDGDDDDGDGEEREEGPSPPPPLSLLSAASA